MSALTAHRTGRMRDIVATLQAEQDRVVRAPLPGVLVVQGGPGTGKTAVALHRAAYLLYTHRDRIARSGVLVVGPSPVFLRYIEQVLPEPRRDRRGALDARAALPRRRGHRPGPAGRRRRSRATCGWRRWSGRRSGARQRRLAAAGAARRRRRRRRAAPAGRRRRPRPGPAVRPAAQRGPGHLRPARARRPGRPARRAPAGSATRPSERGDLLAELRDTPGRPPRGQPAVDAADGDRASSTELLTRPDRLAAGRRRGARPGASRRCCCARPARAVDAADVPLLDEAAELIGADVAVTDAAAPGRGASPPPSGPRPSSSPSRCWASPARPPR